MLDWTKILARCAVLIGLTGSAWAGEAPTEGPPAAADAEAEAPYALPIDGTDPDTFGTPREVVVDFSGFTGTARQDLVVYDLDLVLSPIRLSQVEDLPPWAVGARLLLSEVGERMTRSRYGMVESVGVLQTIHNRLDAKVWNPAGISGIRPWMGCGSGDFHDCATPAQYYGLAQPRSLTPAAVVRDQERLIRLIDAAVASWWLATSDLVDDVTNGGASFMHRCGGTAYGMPRKYCDGRSDPADPPGARATTGPIVFKGAGEYSKQLGRYELVVTRTIDFIVDSSPPEPGLYARYLWGDANGAGWDDDEFQTDPAELEAMWEGDLSEILGDLPDPLSYRSRPPAAHEGDTDTDAGDTGDTGGGDDTDDTGAPPDAVSRDEEEPVDDGTTVDDSDDAP